MPSSPKMNWPFPSENEAPWYEAFEDMVRSQDAAGFASREDRNLVITGGAYIGWDLGTSTLSWSEPILVSSPVTGVTVSIPASSFVLARGDMVFVNLVRAPVQPATHVPEVAQQLPALVDSVYLIAVRIVDEVHFRNDQRLKDGDILPGLGFGVSLGLGNVVGPASATDSAFVLYDLGATLIKDSVVIATGAGVLTTPGTVDGRNVPTDGAKLDLIEPLADVTDAVNVAAAGSLMADGSEDLTGNLAVDPGETIDTREISVDGDKLDLIEPLADVTDAVNVAAAGSLMADGSEDLTSNLTVAAAEEIDGREISTDGAKLDLIEPLADVTDDVNVEAAGALMRDGGNLTGPVTAVALVTVDGRDISEDGDKLDDLTFTGSKNLDTMALDVAANTLKDTNATHSVDMVGATALAIQPNVVTLAKMAQVATATLLGRETAATGDVEALTPAEAAAVLNIEVGAQTNQQVGFGEWTHGNNSLGATTTGTFDVNNATVLAVTVIRFPVFPIAPGISLVRGLTDLSGPGFLQLQDNTDPLGTQVTFLVSSVTNIVDLWVDFTGVVLQNQGTNWGANPYTFNWTPQVDASSHVRRDVSNTADGVSLYFQGSDPIGAPTATKGHIWNLAEAPNELFFSDDDGRNQNVSWWMNNLASHVGHYGIWLNLEQKTSPFEQYPTGDLSIEYNDNADKFYCTYVDGSNDVNAYDSDDGITWSAKKEVDPGTTIGDVSQAASDGIHFGIGADNTFYRSTDLTVANTVAYGTFANITGGCTGLIYDHTLGLWVACGDNGVTGYIETSPTGSTWTLRRTLVATHLPKAMDWDPVGGRAVVVCGSTSLNTYWSDNKTTWTQDTSNNPSIGLGNIWWSKQHGCFFGGDSSQNMHMSTSNTGGTWSTISGMDASHVWRSDDFMCFTGGGALATIYQMGAKGTLVANSTMTKTLSGYIDDYNFQPILNTATQRARIRGGKGVIAWPSYSNNKLMYARYAPPPLT